MTAVDAPPAPPTSAPVLRRLYLARFGFAAVWAAVFAAVSPDLGLSTLALLVVYPAFDVAAAVVDGRSVARSGDRRGPLAVGLYLNMAISAAAAVALLVVGSDDRSQVLVVWGVWSIAAGAVQLVVGMLRRRAWGGQWPLVLSGGLAVLVGASFVASADGATSLASLSGYAALGGIFFLVSALRLGRSGRPSR